MMTPPKEEEVVEAVAQQVDAVVEDTEEVGTMENQITMTVLSTIDVKLSGDYLGAENSMLVTQSQREENT